MFVGGNVNNKFIGNPIDILEWIQTKRDQIEGTLTLFASKTSSLQFHGGFVNQTQNSTYEGGADYSNNDNTIATDLRWQTQVGAHTITLGGDFNTENLRSQSYYYYTVLGITPDSYDSYYGGGYVQDAWNFGHERELDLAVRADEINDDWIDKPNSTINKFIVAPRANFVWEFTEDLTGRLSAGEGWRSPLTFFELDHGLLNNGFDIGVTELEKGKVVEDRFPGHQDSGRLPVRCMPPGSQVWSMLARTRIPQFSGRSCLVILPNVLSCHGL